jgi:hypothetical protein
MKKDKKSIKTFDVYRENPVPPIGMVKKAYNKVVGEDKHYLPDGNLRNEQRREFNSYYQDNRKRFTLYDEWVMKEDSLSKNGLRVFRYICLFIIDGSDEIKLSPTEIAKFWEYKNTPPIINGIIELLDLGLLYRKLGKEPVYFINVNYFFRGKKGDYMEELDRREKEKHTNSHRNLTDPTNVGVKDILRSKLNRDYDL